MLLIQYQKELHAEKLASQSSIQEIIICDRGIIDNEVYSGNELFLNILKDYGMDLNNIICSYDKVVYMDSVAEAYPKIYKNNRNASKFSRTKRLNKYTFQVWEKYNKKIYKVRSFRKFNSKIKEVVQHIENTSGNPNRQMLNVISDEDIIININNILKQENVSLKIQNNVLNIISK